MMRALYLLLIVINCLSSNAQKTVELVFSDEDYKQIIKHPKTHFKDSLSLSRYLSSLRSTAISKGYLTASFDNIKWKGSVADVHFYIGEHFNEATLSIASEELRFVRRHTRINERVISALPLRPEGISSTMEKVLSTYVENGYPFAKVQLENIV